MTPIIPVYGRLMIAQPFHCSLTLRRRLLTTARSTRNCLAEKNPRLITGKAAARATKVSGAVVVGSLLALAGSQDGVVTCDAGSIDPVVKKVKDFVSTAIVP